MNEVVAAALLICSVASLATGGQTPDSGAGNRPSVQLVVRPTEADAPVDMAFSVQHVLGASGGIRTDLETPGAYRLALHGVSAADVVRASA